ncbi:site-specific integrase [Telmatospirillum sp.]|uniref:tyrosine-type recombinase/integrase n=1 Tax=Telmatospirillum sp. TaxID=2079197 RepID=UPI00284A7E4E|nr:site-specific integrase [Telmatospirillum sp.]MDR3439843.1 site-specific integrase [Telmatospirillum sp.]
MSLKLVPRKGSAAWYVRGTVRGQSIYETTGTEDKGLAEAYRAKREAELYDQSVFGARAVVPFNRAALSYLEFEERSPRTIDFVDRLIEHFGSAKLAKIGQAEADEAVRRLLCADAAPSTKVRAVYTPLTAVLMHAHQRGWCDRPNFQRPTQPKGKTRWLTPREALRLINAAAPHLRPLLTFFLCTGARVSEALDLMWDDVDLAAAKAVLRDTKNGEDRPALLPPTAVVSLANLPGREDEVFRRDDGEPYTDKKRLEGGQIKKAFGTACRRAGLIKWSATGKGKVDGACTLVKWTPTLTPHDLRHTWATWAYALSKDFMRLKYEGGWKSLSMVERYAHLMTSDLIPDIALVWGDSHPAFGVVPGREMRQNPCSPIDEVKNAI